MFSDLKLSLCHGPQAWVSLVGLSSTLRQFRTLFSSSDSHTPSSTLALSGWPGSCFTEQTGATTDSYVIQHTQACLHVPSLWPPSCPPRDNRSPGGQNHPQPPSQGFGPSVSPSSGAALPSASRVLELYRKYNLPLPTASHVSILFLCSLNSQLLEKVVHTSPHNCLPSLPIFQPTWLLVPPHHRACSGQGHQQLSCCPVPGCILAARNMMPKPSSLRQDSIGHPDATTQFPAPSLATPPPSSLLAAPP